MLVIDDKREDHSKKEEIFLGALKKYSKRYNTICHFKLHSLHVYPNVIIPYLFLCI